MDGITVKIGYFPGRLHEVALNGGRTVGDAISVAGLDTSGYQIRCQGREVTMDQTLHDGDTVLLVKNVKGAR